ncbi:MAG: YXWGXW repeat-containing protein [Deltaproteobacteria bacterium]|nr:YXWGXW repeat-containing protein [Deltaproteobacteria bacterium]
MLGGVATADRHHGNRGGVRGGRGPVVVRGGGPVVRGGGPVVVRGDRRHYSGPVRANRRVIDRRPIYVSNNQFTFRGGVTTRYVRPAIRQRYYDVRYRPSVIVESYPAQSGYIWVSGQWSWGGSEWVWVSGHYEADPQYSVYYDDGSWE